MEWIFVMVGTMVVYFVLTILGRIAIRARYNKVRKDFGLQPRPLLEGLFVPDGSSASTKGRGKGEQNG